MQIGLQRQCGAVMLVTLIMMVMVTLFAVTSIRMSSTELQVVHNMQLRKELAAASQEGIEATVSSFEIFENLILGETPLNPATTTPHVVQGGRYTVTVNQPVCRLAVVAPGTSLVNPGVGASETTYWEVISSAVDIQTGAQVTTTQGVKMRMPLDSCP